MLTVTKYPNLMNNYKVCFEQWPINQNSHAKSKLTLPFTLITPKTSMCKFWANYLNHMVKFSLCFSLSDKVNEVRLHKRSVTHWWFVCKCDWCRLNSGNKLNVNYSRRATNNANKLKVRELTLTTRTTWTSLVTQQKINNETRASTRWKTKETTTTQQTT